MTVGAVDSFVTGPKTYLIWILSFLGTSTILVHWLQCSVLNWKSTGASKCLIYLAIIAFNS